MSTTRAATEQRASARERLLDAANELFYAEGVQTVGIDRIIERAGVAKASLYNLFGSKEELVAAYLASRHDRTTDRLTRAVDQVDDPRQKILAVFDSQATAVPASPASTAAPSSRPPPRHPRRVWSSKRPTGSGPGCAPCSPTWPSRLEPPTRVPRAPTPSPLRRGRGVGPHGPPRPPGWPRPCASAAEALVDAALARR